MDLIKRVPGYILKMSDRKNNKCLLYGSEKGVGQHISREELWRIVPRKLKFIMY